MGLQFVMQRSARMPGRSSLMKLPWFGILIVGIVAVFILKSSGVRPVKW
jgi:hypothetical protein